MKENVSGNSGKFIFQFYKDDSFRLDEILDKEELWIDNTTNNLAVDS